VRSFDLNAALYREIDDEHGLGTRHRYAAAGAPTRVIDYGQPEGTNVVEVSAACGGNALEDPLGNIWIIS
jgi:hypothetical protein